MQNLESLEENLENRQVNDPITETKQIESLSELISSLFINHSILKTKISSLKRTQQGAFQLPFIRKIGENITVLTLSIIYHINSNYEPSKEDRENFIKVSNMVEQLPSALYTSDYGWNPQQTQKIIMCVDEFLLYLQKNDYVRKEDSISLKRLVKIEIDNLERELKQRSIIASETSKDIFTEYFDAAIKEMRDKINSEDFVEIKNQLQGVSSETQIKILEILKIEQRKNIDFIEQTIKKIYEEKIKALPQVSLLYILTPKFSKPLIQEQNTFSNKVLELLNSSTYNIKTVHILFTLSNLLISYSSDISLTRKIEVCNSLLSAEGKDKQQEALYHLVMLYLGDIQSTFRRTAAFTTIKC